MPRRRSRLLPLLLLVAGVFASCREESPPAAGTDPSLLVSALVERTGDGRPVIFVGLDGADWQFLDGYMARGVMPHLAALAREGRAGVLHTRQPPLSPLLWTTMMTGVGPLAHRILDFTRLDPATGVEEPITAGERRAPAVWNMASWAGKSVAVFGLWATYPAEPVNGLLVADRFSSFTARDAAPPPGVVYPAAREAWARAALAAAEGEVDYEAMRAYLPWLGRAAHEAERARPDPYAHPVSALRRILVETRAYHRLATDWLAGQRPDLAVVYFQGTDTIGHLFAPFAPPRQPSVSAADFARYKDVPERYFAEVDRLLGDYRRLAERSGAALMLASDHGFLWGEGRPERLGSAAAATAGRWHRDEGMYLLWGPGVEGGGRRHADGEEKDPGREDNGSGSIDQVCATLLALLGLPPGKGLAGPPLPGGPIAHGEPFDYAAHFRPPRPARPAALAPAADSAVAEDELAKLRALGYIGPGPARRAPGASTRTAASWNHEGLLLRQVGRAAAARRAFEQALALDPGHASALWNLSDLLWSAGERDRSDGLLLRALAAGLPAGAEHAVSRALAYRREGNPERARTLLDSAVAVLPGAPPLLLTRGHERMQRRDCTAAYADFSAVVRLAPSAAAHAALGTAALCLDRLEEAQAHFRDSLALEPNQPELRRFVTPPPS